MNNTCYHGSTVFRLCVCPPLWSKTVTGADERFTQTQTPQRSTNNKCSIPHILISNIPLCKPGVQIPYRATIASTDEIKTLPQISRLSLSFRPMRHLLSERPVPELCRMPCSQNVASNQYIIDGLMHWLSESGFPLWKHWLDNRIIDLQFSPVVGDSGSSRAARTRENLRHFVEHRLAMWRAVSKATADFCGDW